MNNEELRKELEALNLALLQMAPTEKPLEEKRNRLLAQIGDALNQEDLGGFKLSSNELFDGDVTEFEQTHPHIAQLLVRIEDMLSSIGI